MVYLRGGKKGLTTEEYRTALFGREILRFRYMAIEMAPLDAEVYREGGGPVGAALSALMDHPKASDPVELRFSMMKQVAESELAPLPKFLLVHIIAVYFELTAEEMQRYQRLVSRKEYRKVQQRLERLERGVAYAVNARNPHMGWRYTPRSGDNDSKITSMMLLGLRAAMDLGIEVNDVDLEQPMQLLDRLTDTKTGRTGFVRSGTLPSRFTSKSANFPGKYSEEPTALTLLARRSV